MDLKEAISKRHTVRKYLDKKIPDNLVRQLNKIIEEKNKEYKINIKLITNDSSALNGIIKLILAKNVKNYLIMSGKDSDDLQEKLGYVGAFLMLYAQTLGLNTWWIGGTFNKSVSKYVPGSKVVGVIAIGYGETEGNPHKSKKVDDVAIYEKDKVPEWFTNGVKYSLLAPTALNKQDFKITGKENTVKIEFEKSSFAGVNLGIVKYHFELGAGKENFNWDM